ncbi:hypothetical protein [Tenacibaculum insulae]|uniref:hypothetical protein n=1 Tax=Tenacibaculum insulae TaxID=2029677 RepID=UPI003AB8061E
MIKKIFITGLLIITSKISFSQEKLNFQGQLSAITSFSPDNELDWFVGARYIPQTSFQFNIDSVKTLDFEVAANIATTASFHPFNASKTTTDVDPYRIWARYSKNQFEIRAGLQKIDFGVATLLRPLQWFNQIDPRDPLQLTNGVYGVLARYYFLNNANIWLWGLYGNDKTRGFDVLKSADDEPEFGGRLQLPIPKGEIGFSYHHRTINDNTVTSTNSLSENKYGIDAKWDVTVGLWLEATYSKKNKNIGLLTHQTLLNIGTDYTFGVGNGLNVVAEHLITSFDEKAYTFNNNQNTTALSANYPLGFFDTISAMYYYNWSSKDSTVFINFEHQFEKFSGYVMAYYNPKTQQNIQTNDLTTSFSGPGIRLMLVYNH